MVGRGLLMCGRVVLLFPALGSVSVLVTGALGRVAYVAGVMVSGRVAGMVLFGAAAHHP